MEVRVTCVGDLCLGSIQSTWEFPTWGINLAYVLDDWSGVGAWVTLTFKEKRKLKLELILLLSQIFHSKPIWDGGGHVVGCDGGQSRRAGRGPRAGELTAVLLTISVTGVFLQSIKLWICT